jgi:lipid II:glycine glycyltransferase (peptidoglycan interpeptide bridge formation enzyme)
MHPFYGMYRFKTGFGGEIVHRSGSWDYPFDLQRYETFRHFESSGLLTQSEEKTGI